MFVTQGISTRESLGEVNAVGAWMAKVVKMTARRELSMVDSNEIGTTMPQGKVAPEG